MLLAEIARKAQVSPATVSRAINQPEIVAPETLFRIRAVIDRYNYVPVPIEQRRGPKIRLGTLRRAGLWSIGANPRQQPGQDWFQEHLAGLQANDVRYRLQVSALTSPTPARLPRALLTEKLDGFILQGMEPQDDLLTELEDKPHVWFMTRRSPSYRGDYVEPNNEENGRLAAEYLHARRHRSVAIVATDPDYSAIARRHQAFAAHARELGLTVHTILGVPTQSGFLRAAPSDGEGELLAARLLECSPHATGLYFPSDHSYVAVFSALCASGRRPGRDFDAVLGNHRPALHEPLGYLPATIDINLPLLVRKVVEHLLWRIENPKVPGRIGIAVSPCLINPAFANP